MRTRRVTWHRRNQLDQAVDRLDQIGYTGRGQDEPQRRLDGLGNGSEGASPVQTQNTTRHCSRCDSYLPLTAFGSHKYCRDCYRAYKRDYRVKHKKATSPKVAKPANTLDSKPKTKAPKRERTPEERRAVSDGGYRYHWGVGIDALESMIANQGGLCSSCGEPQQADKPRLAPFGDTSTKTIYGFLCSHCNSMRYAVPALTERPDKLERIRTYLALDHTPLEKPDSPDTRPN
jgi:hypothetical protein